MNTNVKWTRNHTFAHIALILAVIVLGLFITSISRLWAWMITLFLMVAYIFVAGHGITGSLKGTLLDERFKISLSRLQTLLWTILILSAFVTASLYNISQSVGDPLSITIPQELWLTLGISLTSLVGSPLIKSNKRKSQARQEQWMRTRDVMGKQGMDVNQMDAEGVIVVNKNPQKAEWSDLFKGEEIGNAAILDLSKIQMFFFTVSLVLAYAFAIGYMMNGAGAIRELPALSQSQVALLGISHAGYLVNKAAPHTNTQA